MKMYGIKNCDTVKKAKDFLEENEVAYDFVDYKKEPPTEKLLQNWIDKIGIALVLNKQGTTYRKLSDEHKNDMQNINLAIKIMIENPSLIKRPILVAGDKHVVGFNKEEYKKLLETIINN